jgi:hypothetical protein
VFQLVSTGEPLVGIWHGPSGCQPNVLYLARANGPVGVGTSTPPGSLGSPFRRHYPRVLLTGNCNSANRLAARAAGNTLQMARAA